MTTTRLLHVFLQQGPKSNSCILVIMLYKSKAAVKYLSWSNTSLFMEKSSEYK